MKLFGILAVAVVVAFGCWLVAALMPSSPLVASCSSCNVILLSIDTLRADHLGSYGYHRPTSPHLDEFSKDAVLFKTAIAQAPSTAASHGAMLTSRLPATHQALFSRRTKLSADIPTIAELLKARGLRTASFNGGGQLSSAFGFDRGFEEYRSIAGNEGLNDRLIDQVTAAKKWLQTIGKQQFFLFLHTYEVHAPYGPPPQDLALFNEGYKGPLTTPIHDRLLNKINTRRLKIGADDARFIVSNYDAEIRSADRAFDELRTFLREQGLYENTLLIVTSDHGEEFGEHGNIGRHSHSLFDELLKVPLLIKFPKQAAASTSVPSQVRSIDIPPTILDLLEVPLASGMEGKSLLSLVNETSDAEPFKLAVSQKDSKQALPTSVRSKKWKLVRRRLFDLENDPREKIDLAAGHPDEVAELTSIADVARKEPEANKGSTTEINPATLEQLKTLGYLNQYRTWRTQIGLRNCQYSGHMHRGFNSWRKPIGSQNGDR